VRELLMGCAVYLLALFVVNIPSQQVAQATNARADYYNLATVAVDEDQIAESIPLYARALAVDPTYRDARIGFAHSLWQVGNFDDARREFEMAGVAPPDTLSGEPLDNFLEQLSKYTDDKDYQGALEFLDRSFPRDRDAPAEIWSNRAMVENQLGLYDHTIESLLKGAAKEPDSPEWFYRAGVIADQHGDEVKAEEFYRMAIEKYAAYAPARLELGFRAIEDGDLETAQEQLGELRRIHIPDDSTRRKVDLLSASVDSMARAEGQGQNY